MLPVTARAAIRPVAVVPMLAPRVSGYIRSRDMIPIPTRGVIADVKMELLWTKKVQIAPVMIARYPVK